MFYPSVLFTGYGTVTVMPMIEITRVMRCFMIFTAGLVCIAGCGEATHDVSGTVSSVGSSTSSGGFTISSTTRYIKLDNDPNIYDCWVDGGGSVPACGAIAPGQKVSLSVDKYGHVHDMTYVT